MELKRTNKNDFAVLLNKYRAKSFPGKSNAAIAASLGLSRQRLNQWLLGSVMPPSDLLPAVLVAFQVPCSKFLELGKKEIDTDGQQV